MLRKVMNIGSAIRKLMATAKFLLAISEFNNPVFVHNIRPRPVNFAGAADPESYDTAVGPLYPEECEERPSMGSFVGLFVSARLPTRLVGPPIQPAVSLVGSVVLEIG